MNKKTLCAIIAIVTMFVAVAMTPRIIVINNKPVAVNDIDSITFDVTAIPPIQKVWKGGLVASTILSDGESAPFLTDMPLDAGIYRIATPSEEWDLMYVTPIGYFFRGNLGSLMGDEADENKAEADGDKKLWYYESFDALKTAQMQVYGIGWTKAMDYGVGVTDYSYNNDTITIITHETEEFQHESRRYGSYKQPAEEIESDELRLSLYLHTMVYDKYDYENWEGDLQQLIADFASVVELPVVSKDADTAIKTMARETGAKVKRLHDRNFAIVPRTGAVYDRDIYDCSVKHVYGRIYTPSSNFLKEAEYGILLDKNPKNLTVDNAEIKVQMTQQSVMSDFNSYFSNLQADTKYYYCTYCIIPKNRLETYHFRYGDKNATTGYGKAKSFSTKSALLMNIVIKNEGRSVFNDRQVLTLPLCVNNITYKWNKEEQTEEFNYNLSLEKVPDGFNYNNYLGMYIQEDNTKYEFFNITLSSEAKGSSNWRYGFGISNNQINIALYANYSYYKQQSDWFFIGPVATHLEDQESHDFGANLFFSHIMDENWHIAEESEIGYSYILTQGTAGVGFGCFCHHDWDVSACSATLADFYAMRDAGTAEALVYKKEKDGKIEKETYALFCENTHNGYGDDFIYRVCEKASMLHIENLHNTLKMRMVYVGEKLKAPTPNMAKVSIKKKMLEGGIGSPKADTPQFAER